MGFVQKVAILVLGMHRSGTSSVSGGVSFWGASLPKNLMKPNKHNPKGYFESDLICAFNDSLMAKIGTSWDDWRPINDVWVDTPMGHADLILASRLLDEEFEGAPFIVIKDPRFCRLGLFWKNALLKSGYEGKYILVFRNPIEVAKSLKTRQGMSVSESLILWLRYNIDAEFSTRKASRSILNWNEYIEYPAENLNEAAKEISIDHFKYSKNTDSDLGNFVSKHLYREISKDIHRHIVGRWVYDAYNSLRELRVNPNSISSIETLDKIRKELENSSELFGGLFVDLKNKQLESKDALQLTEVHCTQLEAARAAVDVEATRLRDALAASENQASHLILEREQLASQLAEHGQALNLAEEHCTQLEAARAALDLEIIQNDTANKLKTESIKNEYNNYKNVTEALLDLKNNEISQLKEKTNIIYSIIRKKSLFEEILFSKKLEKIRTILCIIEVSNS
jgi:hypothetical protein